MKTLTLIFALLFSVGAFAEVKVVVHPSNASAIDASVISRIFLGKSKSFPGGEQAVPISQAEGAPSTTAFNANVLKKSDSQLKAYWSKLIFTGKGTPPKVVGSDAEVIQLISANPNMIGFVSGTADVASVKVVSSF